MKCAHPPDNLPIVPAGHRRPWEVKNPQKAPNLTTGRLELTTDDIAAFKSALERDVGAPVTASDDDIRAGALRTLRLILLLRQIQLRRRG